MALRTDFIILILFVIHATTIVNIHLPFAALAVSPSVNHQEIEMKEVPSWEVVPMGERAEDIHDGRKIFFNPYNSTDIAPCKDTSLFKKLPNISSVSYNSDGRTLNSTFWLDRGPLINDYFQSSARASDLKQVSVHIYVDDIVPSQYRTINELITTEKTFLTEKYHDVTNTKIISNSTAKLDNNLAAEIEFTGNLNYSTLGHPDIRGKDTFTVKNGNLYRILYLAEPDQYPIQLPNITKMVESIRINDSTQSTEKNTLVSIVNNRTNATSEITLTDTNEIFNETYSKHGLTVKYPYDWGKIERETPNVILFSPIKGPHLIGIGYIVSLDVPSVYDTDTDYVAKVMWWDRLYNRTWFKLLEEISFAGTTRTLEERPNFTESLEKQKNYDRPKPHIFIPIDLRLINSPDQYLIVFITEARVLNNGFVCDLIQKTGQVSAPPPKFSISPSINSTSIGPRETKTVEVKVRSFSDIPYTIFLKPDSSKYMKATFSPSKINIPPLGWASSQLTIKSNGTTTWDSTTTETLRIVAQPNLTESGNMIAFNTKRSVETSPALIPNTFSVGLTITFFNSVDNALHVLSSISAPVSVVAALAGLIGGGIGWLLKRTNRQQDNKGG